MAAAIKDIELVIFDMDGLMFDTEKISCIAWEKTLKAYGYTFSDKLFHQIVGTNAEYIKEVIKEHFGEGLDIDKVLREKYRAMDEILAKEGIPIKPGLIELLCYLNQKGIKKAVATSTDRVRAERILTQAEVYNYFDTSVCGDEVTCSKPDPEIFLKAAEKLGVQPERCMVLEDSEAGTLAAKRAGMIPMIIPDIKEPSEEIEKLAYGKVMSLQDIIKILP